MTRSVKPVESFGPELLSALLSGAKEKIEVPLPWKAAVRFRQRIQQLRHSMRATSHSQYPLASQARVSISWDDKVVTKKSSRGVKWPGDPLTPCIVTIAPADSEFTDVLKAAGVEVKPLSEVFSTVSDVPSDYLEELLGKKS